MAAVARPDTARRGARGGPPGWLLAIWLLGCGGVVLGALLPWLRTGQAQRSAFRLARSADRLGLVDSTPRQIALIGLFASPMMLGLGILALSLGRWRWAAGLGSFLSIAGMVAGLVGWQLPPPRQLGPFFAGAAGVVAGLASVGLARSGGRAQGIESEGPHGQQRTTQQQRATHRTG